MRLEALTKEQCEQVRVWRNAEMECWRTPFMLTKDMQEDFYQRCCDRNSPHRYWAIIGEMHRRGEKTETFLGMGGITYIQWENSIGEITLIIDPTKRDKGYGEKAVDLILDQAFNHLNLKTVFGEAYLCNGSGVDFWRRVAEKCEGTLVMLPGRKFNAGVYYTSLYFSIDRDDFNNRNKSG